MMFLGLLGPFFKKKNAVSEIRDAAPNIGQYLYFTLFCPELEP
jgi:hypothetical protein